MKSKTIGINIFPEKEVLFRAYLSVLLNHYHKTGEIKNAIAKEILKSIDYKEFEGDLFFNNKRVWLSVRQIMRFCEKSKYKINTKKQTYQCITATTFEVFLYVYIYCARITKQNKTIALDNFSSVLTEYSTILFLTHGGNTEGALIEFEEKKKFITDMIDFPKVENKKKSILKLYGYVHKINSNITPHVKYSITGYICSIIGILPTEEEYNKTNHSNSHKQYLVSSIKNIVRRSTAT